MEDFGAACERGVDFTYLNCTVASSVDLQVEELGHLECDDTGRSTSVQHELDCAGEAGEGKYGALGDVDSLNPDNSAGGYLGKAGLG